MAEKQQATYKGTGPKPNASREEKDMFIRILDNYIEKDEKENK